MPEPYQLSVWFRLRRAFTAAVAVYEKLGEYRVLPGDTIVHTHEIRITVEE
jgi:hypothetical protein